MGHGLGLVDEVIAPSRYTAGRSNAKQPGRIQVWRKWRMAISMRHAITQKETPIGRKLEAYKILLHFHNLLGDFVAVRQL